MRKYPQRPKTHGTVENTPRVDSFELESTGFIFAGNRSYEYSTYYEPDRDVIEIEDDYGNVRATIEIQQIENKSKQKFFICGCCGKRTRYLYAIGDYQFRCRHCAKLNYYSQQRFIDYLDYYYEGLKYAEENLGWQPPDDIYPEIFDSYVPERPRYMHKSTYKKHLMKYRWYQRKYREGYEKELMEILMHVRKHYQQHK